MLLEVFRTCQKSVNQ